MFLAIFHSDELLLTCWSAINHLDCMSKSTFPSKFYFFSWFFICPHFFLICIFLSWSLFFFFFFLILFLFLCHYGFFLFLIIFLFWSSSNCFCLCSAPLIHFLHDLKYFSSASIKVHFPWNKVYLSLLSLFKRKEEKLSVWSLSLFTLSWLPFFFTLIFDTSIISNWLFVCTVTIVWYYRLIIFLYLEKWLLYCFLTIITVSFLLKLCIVVATTISRG